MSDEQATADAEAADVLKTYYAARAAEYDSWYLRRGRYARSPEADAAWAADLEAAASWLNGLHMRGDIVELAAGTGWWSTHLAKKGLVALYDANAEPLDIAQQRLAERGQLVQVAEIAVRDAWERHDDGALLLARSGAVRSHTRPRLDSLVCR